MSRRVVFSPQATETLERLYVEVAAWASPETALRLIWNIEIRCDVLGDFPMLGRARDDLMDGLRILTLDRRITVAYRITPGRILIARIFYRGEDFEAALRADPSAED